MTKICIFNKYWDTRIVVSIELLRNNHKKSKPTHGVISEGVLSKESYPLADALDLWEIPWKFQPLGPNLDVIQYVQFWYTKH